MAYRGRLGPGIGPDGEGFVRRKTVLRTILPLSGGFGASFGELGERVVTRKSFYRSGLPSVPSWAVS
jgi:hypothetical protein